MQSYNSKPSFQLACCLLGLTPLVSAGNRSGHPLSLSSKKLLVLAICLLKDGTNLGLVIEELQSCAGHGSQSRDPTGDEADGMNETLCPTDFQQAGQIVDDEINRALINQVPQGVSSCQKEALHTLLH